jgi:hypothetical protein
VGRVIIGMDPHKRSATIEVTDERETVLATGRFGTDQDGYQRMLAVGRGYPLRLWAVEGANGIGRHLAQRLVADGETVVDVPANCRPRCGCSPPGRAARPTRLTRTAWQWPRCGPRGPVCQSWALRVLERHRTAGCLLGGPAASPVVEDR